MTLNSLRLARNVLLRCFAIGFCFTLIFAMLTFGAWDSWMGPVTRMAHTEPAAVIPVVLNFFADLRIVMIFFFLAPALAFHWTLKREEKKAGGTLLQEKMQAQTPAFR